MKESDVFGALTVVPTEAKTEIQDALALQDKVLGIKEITDTAGYQSADTTRTNIKQRLKQIDEIRKKITKPLDEAKANVMSFFRPAETALKESHEWLDNIMIQYEEVQEQKRRKEEARLTAEAKQREEEAALAAAVAAEEEGDLETADAILNDPVITPPVRLATMVPKVGSYTKETWHAEVYDSIKLIIDVANGKAPAQCLTPNMTFLNAQARALKGAMAYAGVRAVCTKIRASKP